MRSDTSRLPLVLAAVAGGIALFVAGFFIAAEMRSAVAGPIAEGTAGLFSAKNIDHGNITLVSDDGTWRKYHTDYPIIGGWMDAYLTDCHCAPDGWIWVHQAGSNYGIYETSITQEEYDDPYLIETNWSWGIYYVYGTNQVCEYGQFGVGHYPDSISYSTESAVGGIGELPPMAGMGDSPARNYAIAALLALVAVVAFAAGGWYARRRWMHG